LKGNWSREAAPGRTPPGTRADDLVVATIRAHASSLLATARRHSLCADDAHDAYQRALEIFIRRASSLDPDGVVGWLHTVVKHEAMAVRRARQRFVAAEEVDLDAHEATGLPTSEERVDRFEVVARAAEALQRLKPQEVQALWLKAQGHSYREIASITGWTYTKVNRCLTEGRRNFLDRYAGIESGDECARWAPALSALIDGEATPAAVADLQPHLRRCTGCRATVRELRQSAAPLAALFPMPALVARPPNGEGAGLLTRLYEAITAGVHDRLAASATRVQAAVDVAGGGKVAAVAASAAAVAGGGITAVDRVLERSPGTEPRVTAVAPDDEGRRHKSLPDPSSVQTTTPSPRPAAPRPAASPALPSAPAPSPQAAEFDFETQASAASTGEFEPKRRANAAPRQSGGTSDADVARAEFGG
jgi:RNA polymerase sigma factor (sigma-70 family)